MYIQLPPGIKRSQMGIVGLPLTHRVKILQKIKSGTSHILHHTSHITYCRGICKFYKIVVIKIVVPFNNLLKLILRKVVKYFLYENYRIFNTNVSVKSRISQANHFTAKQGTFLKVRFSSKIEKKVKFMTFFKSNVKKVNLKTSHLAFFSKRSAWCCRIFYNWLFYNC